MASVEVDNHHEARITPTRLDQRLYWGRQAMRKCAAVVASTGALLALVDYTTGLDDDRAAHSQHQSLDNLQVVIINPPHPGVEDQQSDATPSSVKQVLRDANKELSEVTRGKLTVPVNAPIHIVEQYATGTHKTINGGEVPCVSEGDMAVARQKAFESAAIPHDTRTAIAVNAIDACFSIPESSHDVVAAAQATAGYNGEPITQYSRGYFSLHTFLHEEGHAEHETHSGKYDCTPETQPEGGVIAAMERRAVTDIADIVASGECRIPLNSEGNLDQYGDDLSVMGSGEALTRSDPYNFVEVNELAPDVAVINDVKPEAAHYQLGMQPGDTRGIRFELPPNHPLDQLDHTIRTLSVGLDHNKEGQASVRLLAGGLDAKYVLATTFAYHPADHVPNNEPQTIYVDRALGIRISASSVARVGKGMSAPEKVAITIDRMDTSVVAAPAR